MVEVGDKWAETAGQKRQKSLLTIESIQTRIDFMKIAKVTFLNGSNISDQALAGLLLAGGNVGAVCPSGMTPDEVLARTRAPAPIVPAGVGIAPGDRLVVMTGNRRLDLRARNVVTVSKIELCERRSVKIVVEHNGRYVATLYARHVNRLADGAFNTNTGDPTEIVRFAIYPPRRVQL